jgi:hypothetical protein
VRNFLQHFVTDDASVIDAFEMFDIAEQKSQSGFFAIGADELAMDKIHDDDAIPKRSEMVVSSSEAHLFVRASEQFGEVNLGHRGVFFSRYPYRAVFFGVKQSSKLNAEDHDMKRDTIRHP